MGVAVWSSGIGSMLARFLMRVELQQPVLLLRMFEVAVELNCTAEVLGTGVYALSQK
jgi:hypothetical protein